MISSSDVRPWFSRGFTLIELLLVMSLIGLATSLVAPRLFSAYRKIQMQSEVKQVLSLLNAISYSAFIRNRRIEVTLNKESVCVAGKSLLRLEHITFPETELTFIRSGLCDHDKIEYQAGDETCAMSLPTL